MLTTLQEICRLAEKENMAIGAFNVMSLATLKSIVRAAEELDNPVIIQFTQSHECFNSLEDVGPLMMKYARQSSVPVCVHLDHGEDLGYLRRALEIGFTGIMYDGSRLSYEENLENSRKAVEMAAEFGAGVEAELGSMGALETGSGTGVGDCTKIYTDPAQAADFVRQTGIDALACSFGTTHGIYLTKPVLNFDIVSQVRKNTGGVPVVMHGGSGVSAEDFRSAIGAGVRKFNYFTYMDKAGANAVKARLLEKQEAHPLFTELTVTAEKAMQENVRETIRVFRNR